MTNENDKATQALDHFWTTMDRWMGNYLGTEEWGDVPTALHRDLAKAYQDWIKELEPPGDPHKEWVDANKLKPNDVFQPVLVKTTSSKIGLATWTPECNVNGDKETWRVQFFMERWYWTKTSVTHWRYIPKDDND